MRCLNMKAEGLQGCSGGTALSVEQAGRPQAVALIQGWAKQTLPAAHTVVYTFGTLCAYVAWENTKTHSLALTRNLENCLRPLEVNKRLKN